MTGAVKVRSCIEKRYSLRAHANGEHLLWKSNIFKHKTFFSVARYLVSSVSSWSLFLTNDKREYSIRGIVQKIWKKRRKIGSTTVLFPTVVIAFATDFGVFHGVLILRFLIRRFRKKPEVAWKRGLRALRPSRRPAVKTNGCRKKFQDGASKYWSCQIDTRGKNGSLKIYRLKVNQVKFC